MSLSYHTAIQEKKELERRLQEQAKRPTPKPRTGLLQQQREMELQSQNEQLRTQLHAVHQQLQEAREQQSLAHASTAASYQMETRISQLELELDKVKAEGVKAKKAREGAEGGLMDARSQIKLQKKRVS